MPTNTTTTTPKKRARRQVRRVDGRLQVVFVDVQSGQIVNDLTGYEILGDNNSTPTPSGGGSTTTDNTGGFATGDYSDGTDGPSDQRYSPWGEHTGPRSQGSGDILKDAEKTFGGLIQQGVNLMDHFGIGIPAIYADKAKAGPSGKPTIVTNSAGQQISSRFLDDIRSTTKPPEVTKVTQKMTPSGGLGGAKDNPSIPSGGMGVGGGTTSSLGPSDLNPVAQEIVRQFKDAGYNQAAISAMLAAAEHESGFRPEVVGMGDAKGIFQWDDRRDAMESWVKKNYGDVNSVEGQVAFALHELETTESKAKDMLMSAKTLNEANLGAIQFERFQGYNNSVGAAERKDRLASAAKFLPEVMAALGPVEGAEASPSGLPMPAPLIANPNANAAGLKAGALGAGQANIDPIVPSWVNPQLAQTMMGLNKTAGVTPPWVSPPNWRDPTPEEAAGLVVGEALPPGVGLSPARLEAAFQNVANERLPMDNVGQGATFDQLQGFRAPAGNASPINANPMAQAGTNQGPFAGMTPDAKAAAESYLETVNKSLGSPTWDTTFGNEVITNFKDHPDRKTFLGDGADFTTAAGYGGITNAAWKEYAPKAGVTDFSLDSQKAVMWKMATDNYNMNTGRDLLIDLMSGNPDRIAGAFVNNANVWGTLPGGKVSNASLPQTVQSFAETAERALGTGLGQVNSNISAGVNAVGGFVSNPNASNSTLSQGPSVPTLSSSAVSAASRAVGGFASAPSTSINSAGQPISTSQLNAINQTSGFASNPSSSSSGTGSVASNSGGGKSAAAAGSAGVGSGGSSSSSGTGSVASNGASTSTKSGSSYSGSSAASAGSGAVGSGNNSGPKASGSQTVTTSSGGTITKAQSDAIRKL